MPLKTKQYESGREFHILTACPCGYEFAEMENRWKHYLEDHEPDDFDGLSPLDDESEKSPPSPGIHDGPIPASKPFTQEIIEVLNPEPFPWQKGDWRADPYERTTRSVGAGRSAERADSAGSGGSPAAGSDSSEARTGNTTRAAESD